MKHVTFNDHHIDTRTLGPDDLQKVGVEGFEETTFFAGQPLEVEVTVADALVGNPDLFGDFSFYEGEAEQVVLGAGGEGEDPSPKKSAKTESTGSTS